MVKWSFLSWCCTTRRSGTITAGLFKCICPIVKYKYKYKYKCRWSLTLSCTTRGVKSGSITVGLRLSTHHRKQHLREAAKSSFNAATKRHNILIEQRRKRRFVRKIFLSRLEIEGALVKPASLSDPMKQLLSTQGWSASDYFNIVKFIFYSRPT